MAGDGVVDKVAARLTMDITPAQKALLTLSADYAKFNQQLVASDATMNQQLFTSDEERLKRIQQLELDSTTARAMATTLMYKQMDLADQQFLADQERRQAAANATQERQNEAHMQKMYQSDQMYQERMAQLQARGSSGSGSSPGFLGSIGRNALEVAGGMALFSLVSELAKIPMAAFQAQDSMVKLKQVLEMGVAPQDIQRYGDLNGVLQQLQQTAGVIAQTYGVDLNVVIDAMSMIGRKFKDTADIVVATDTALQMFAVDNVPVTESVKSLEAMMSQFNLTMPQARQALFELSAAAHEFQVTGTDLMNAIERSGASFSTLKMNTGEAIAAIATLAQMTGQAGGTIGNAWKSIDATLTSDKGVKALHQLGVEAFNANGNLKDGVQILQDMQSVWPKLTDSAKIHFAEVLAGGKYQYERLLTFLNDYSGQYQRALQAMTQANAQTQQELIKTAMESPTKQLQMTKAAFEVLATTIGQNATPVLIQFLTEIREGTNYIKDHWQNIEHWLKTGAELAFAYVAWKEGVKLYSAVVETATIKNLTMNMTMAKTKIAGGEFAAGMEIAGSAALGFGAKITATLAKMFALIAAFQTVQDLIGNNKVEQLQDKLNTLNAMNSSHPAGSIVQNSINDFKNANYVWGVEDFFAPAAIGLKNLVHGNFSSSSKQSALQAQIEDTKRQLQQATQERKQNADEEVKKSLDNLNKIVDEEMKKTLAGPPPGGGGGSGNLNISPTGGKGTGSGLSNFMQPFKDASAVYTEMLTPFTDALDQTKGQLDMVNARQQALTDSMKSGNLTVAQAAAYAQNYSEKLVDLKTHQDELHASNEAIRSMLPNIQSEIAQVNAQYANGSITAQEHTDALNQLLSKEKELQKQLTQNSAAWAQDASEMARATQEAENLVIQALQKGYDTERQMQDKALADRQKAEETALKNEAKTREDAINDQIKGIDQLLSAEQRQWAAESAQEKLTDLQTQQSQLRANLDQVMVDANGNVVRTYDLQKDAQLAQQIQDQQTTIAHDAEKNRLDDQKTALQNQLTQTQDYYQQAETDMQNRFTQEKADLDAYWTSRLSTESLQQQAEQKIKEQGYQQALTDAQQFAAGLIAAFAAQNAASIANGKSVSGSVGLGVGTSTGSTSTQHQYGMSDADYQTFMSNGLNYAGSTLDQQGILHNANDALRQQYGIPAGAYPGFKEGGVVPEWMGIKGVDSVPAMLTPGEIVVPSFDHLMDFASKANQSSQDNRKSVSIQHLEIQVNDVSGKAEEVAEAVFGRFFEYVSQS